MCPCGKPLHYTDPMLRLVVEKFIEVCGPNIRVTVGERTWLVPRHYIALHGLKADELPRLGFQEITRNETNVAEPSEATVE